MLGLNYQFATHHQSVLTGNQQQHYFSNDCSFLLYLTGVAVTGVALFLVGFEAGPGPLFFVIINEIFDEHERQGINIKTTCTTFDTCNDSFFCRSISEVWLDPL
jgi:hypothetical protein